METQTVEYELPFQSMSFPTDAPVLVLSEGNSLLPVCVLVLELVLVRGCSGLIRWGLRMSCARVWGCSRTARSI